MVAKNCFQIWYYLNELVFLRPSSDLSTLIDFLSAISGFSSSLSTLTYVSDSLSCPSIESSLLLFMLERALLDFDGELRRLMLSGSLNAPEIHCTIYYSGLSGNFPGFGRLIGLIGLMTFIGLLNWLINRCKFGLGLIWVNNGLIWVNNGLMGTQLLFINPLLILLICY